MQTSPSNWLNLNGTLVNMSSFNPNENMDEDEEVKDRRESWDTCRQSLAIHTLSLCASPTVLHTLISQQNLSTHT